ncbi:MAG: hypothetical protein WB341_14720 [Terracidiphilus sp.]
MEGNTLILILLGVSVVIALVFWSRRKENRVEEALNWPTTEATVQTAAVERVGGGRYAPDLPVFAFSYVVEEEYYSGRFALDAKGDRADDLVKEMIDRKLAVCYDPKRPSTWFIPDESIEGCEVYQKLSDKLDPLYPKD